MIKKMTALAAACAMAFSMTGCNDEDDAPATNIAMVGQAAVGAAVANATVMAVGANGVTLQTTTDADGNYTLNVATLTAPVFIKVSGGTYDHDADPLTPNVANTATLFSLTPKVGGRVNATPLTTLALQTAFQSSSLDSTFMGWGTGSVSFSLLAFTNAINTIAANFATQMQAAGIPNPNRFNYFTFPFPVNGTGIDGVLDALSCSTTDGTPLFVSCTYNGSSVPFSYTPSNLLNFTFGQNLTVVTKVGLLPEQTFTPTVIVPPPPSAGFCGAEGVGLANAYLDVLETVPGVSGNVTINSCSLSGNVGVVTATVNGISGKATFTWN
jgi:hypothetical protein